MEQNNYTVVGLCGCSAAGKSTLVGSVIAATKAYCDVDVVTCDDYYKPLERCPTFDLEGLPWPENSVPDAFKARGNADLNVPGAVHWMGVLQKVHALQLAAEEAYTQPKPDANNTTKPRPRVIIVEGLLLLGADEGAQLVRDELDRIIVLNADSDSAKQKELWLRKLNRSHLGKPSYAARGVTETMYQVYWDAYIEPRWQEHGASRARDPTVMEPWLKDKEGAHLALSCHGPVPRLVEQVLATGWFQGTEASSAGGSDSVVEDKSTFGGSADSRTDGANSNKSSSSSSRDDRRCNGSSRSSANISAEGSGKSSQNQQRPSKRNERAALEKHETASDNNDGVENKEVRYKDDVGFPAVTSIAVAVLVTGLLSTLGTAERSAVLLVLGSVWWQYRGRH